MSAFAIGFPTWYRWPFTETESNATGTAKQITTWQRQWGGGRKKHGVQRQIANGKVIESLVYRNGLRHGPYESTHDHGQFVNDKKEGVWTAPDRTMSWRNGKLDGPSEIRLRPITPLNRRQKMGKETSNPSPPPEPRVFKLLFVDGRLTEMNGKPAANRLFEALETETIDDHTRNELYKTTSIDVIEMPLKDTVLFLSDMHQIPFSLDPKLGPNHDLPLTNTLRGIDLCSALLLLTAPHGLGCDYRYGSIWITTAEDCNEWHDPTGVGDIKPPKGSALERAWKETSPAVDVVQTPLTKILAYLKVPLAIEIDASQLDQLSGEAQPTITATLRGLRFCDTLGQLLYKTHCRCQLEGDKLIILPPPPGTWVPSPEAPIRTSMPKPAPTSPRQDPFPPP